jgi:hypothetical protein
VTRDVPTLPWTDPRLWFALSIMAGCIAASAVYGIVGTILRGVPEPFTTDDR